MSGAIGRRELLRWAIGIGAAATVSTRANAQLPSDLALTRLLDQFMEEDMRASPEQATALGLDDGSLARLRSQLNDRSAARRAISLRRWNDQLRRLAAFEPKTLSAESAVHRRVVLEIL